MKIIESPDYAHMSRKAANIISAQVILKPTSVLGLATGSTPIGAYRQLIGWYNKGDIDFSAVRTVNLDEYVGLGPSDEQSYAHFMRVHFFDGVNIDLKNTHIPNGLEPDARAECQRYDSVLRSLGRIDLQLLGLGHNGHIGFNEPADCFTKGTHLTELSSTTVEANRRFFEDVSQVPRFAYTMGICDIMQARRVVMVVSGASKARIVRDAFFGPVTPRVPASILQLHRDFTLVADREALSLVERE